MAEVKVQNTFVAHLMPGTPARNSETGPYAQQVMQMYMFRWSSVYLLCMFVLMFVLLPQYSN